MGAEYKDHIHKCRDTSDSESHHTSNIKSTHFAVAMAQLFHENLEPSIPSTVALANSPLFKIVDKNLDINTRAQIVYDRARSISRAYGQSA